MSEPLTEAELAVIEARANAATPGPWHPPGSTYIVSDTVPVKVCQLHGPWVENPNRDTDAPFIAAARADVPRLVAEIRRLRQMLTWARELELDYHDPMWRTLGTDTGEESEP